MKLPYDQRRRRGCCAKAGRSVPPARPCRVRPAGDERGFVIIAVVAVLALLAALTIMLAGNAAQDARLVAHLSRQARAEALADGVTRLVMRNLAINPSSAGSSANLRLDGVSTTCAMAGGLATITVTSVDGLVNLNLASPELLERLFSGVVASREEARRLAEAVVDFRSEGEMSEWGSDKAKAYATAGLRYRPKNAPFESVGEIDQLPGLTPDLRERLRPLLTVHSHTAIINPALASLAVVRALTGTPASWPETADAKALADLRAAAQLPAEFTTRAKTRSSVSSGSNTYVIRVSVAVAGGRFVRQAVADLSSASPAGGGLKEWIGLDPRLHGVIGAGEETHDCLSVLKLDR